MHPNCLNRFYYHYHICNDRTLPYVQYKIAVLHTKWTFLTFGYVNCQTYTNVVAALIIFIIVQDTKINFMFSLHFLFS